MTTTTVELRWSDGENRTVEAKRVGDWFAVHEVVRPDGTDQDTVGGEDRRWRATHVATGLALPRRFLTEAGATAYATEIAVLADWSGTDREVLTQRATDAGHAIYEASERAAVADLATWCDQELPGWPHDKPPTADHLARYHTVQAALLGHRVRDLVDAGAIDKDAPREQLTAYFDAAAAFLNAWSVAYLLRAVQEHAPSAAPEVVADLWDAIESGETPSECSYDWLVQYRIDPAKVAAQHAEYKAKRAAGGEPA